jgi:hypothetical protein
MLKKILPILLVCLSLHISVVDTASSATINCGISEARLEQIHTLLNQVAAQYTNSENNHANYPGVIFDVQEVTANALKAAENCRDIGMIDTLATLYAIPFGHLQADRNGDMVWLANADDATGMQKLNYEVVLDSSQFIYATAKLINIIAHTDYSLWTPAMKTFISQAPEQQLIAHLDRWLNKKSMWIWPECGFSQPNSLFEYTFPEYVQRKSTQSLGIASSAPSYCNMVLEPELWVAAAGTELLDAKQTISTISISGTLQSQLASYVRSSTALFESRVSTVLSTSPLCGGACDAGTFDAGLRPDGSWDISHARRLVQIIDSLYGHPGISQPSTFTQDSVSNLFGRAIAYLAFNGDFNNPAFNNFLNGKNVTYLTFGPFGLSSSYFRSGFGFWGQHESTVGRINDALIRVLDNQIATAFLTPGGIPPGGALDLLGFYTSLTRPGVVVATPAPSITPATQAPSPTISPSLTPTPAITSSPSITPTSTAGPNASATPLPGRIKLMRSASSPKVFYITEKGFKRWIPTAEIFLSYGNRWEDIALVPQSQLTDISDNILIKLPSDPKIYKLENRKKRWITTAAAFNRNKFRWDTVAPVNQTEFDYYAVGTDIR